MMGCVVKWKVKILVIDIQNESKGPVLRDSIASKKKVSEGIDQIDQMNRNKPV